MDQKVVFVQRLRLENQLSMWRRWILGHKVWHTVPKKCRRTAATCNAEKKQEVVVDLSNHSKSHLVGGFNLPL